MVFDVEGIRLPREEVTQARRGSQISSRPNHERAPRVSLAQAAALISLFVVLACFAITHGTMDVLAPEVRSRTFVSMWDHMRQGRFDVDPSAVETEAILKDGRAYAYWGPFPALLRGAIEVFVRRDGRDWGRISTLLAAIVSAAVMVVMLQDRVNRIVESPAKRRQLSFLLSIAWLFGSPLWIAMASAFLYHEAILWALAWSMVFLSVYSDVHRDGWTVLRGILLGGAAGLALLSRMPCGVGPGLGLIASVATVAFGAGKNGRRSAPSAGVASALGVYSLLVGFALFVNYGRWGNPLEFTPIENYVEHLADPARSARFKAFGALNVRRIPVALEYYFLPERGNVTGRFPFLAMPGWDPWKDRRGDTFDYMEPYNVALPVSAPFVFLVSIVGAAAFARRPRGPEGLLLACFAAQAILILTYMGTAMRYQIDMMPLYFVSGLLAIPAFAGRGSSATSLKSGLLAIVVVLSVYCATITMLLHKSLLFAIPWETRVRIFTWIHS